MARKSKPPCRWWEHHDSFDHVSYYTDCTDGALLPEHADIAALCWQHEVEFCPWCGGELWYCDEDEVAADDRDDAEYREGVRYGLYGY